MTANEKDVLDVLHLIRSIQIIIQSNTAHVSLFSKQNIDLQQLIQQKIFHLLYKNKYYYSNLYVLFRGLIEADKLELKKVIPFLDKFRTFQISNNKEFNFVDSEEEEKEINFVDNAKLINKLNSFSEFVLLATFTYIPRKFHYFILESDADKFVDFLFNNNFNKEIIKSFATAAFVSPLFVAFVKETIIPHIKEFNGAIEPDDNLINQILKQIKISLFENRRKCPLVIIKILSYDCDLFEGFIDIIREKLSIFGLNHYYESNSKIQNFFTQWKASSTTFSNILTIQKRIDQILALLNEVNINKLKEKLDGILPLLWEVLDSSSYHIINQLSKQNLTKNTKESINKLKVEFKKLYMPNSSLCFNNYIEQNGVINNSFQAVFYDSFDDLCFYWNQIMENQNNKKQKIKPPNLPNYEFREHLISPKILLQNDKTQFNSYTDPTFKNLRELIKLLPILPFYEKLPLPLKANENDENSFNLLECLRFHLLQGSPTNFFTGIKYIAKLQELGFMIIDKNSCYNIKEMLNNMVFEHDKNRRELIKLKKIEQNIDVINNLFNPLLKVACGSREFLFYPPFNEEKGISKIIEKEKRDPYQDPKILFNDEQSVFNQIIKFKSLPKTTNINIKYEICLHYTYKLITYYKFIKNRPEILSFDKIFSYSIQQNNLSILNDIEKKIISFYQSDFIIDDLHVLFHGFNRDLRVISYDLSKMLSENSDPLQKISNLEEIASRLNQFLSNSIYSQTNFEVFLEYFLVYFSHLNVFSNVIFLEEYYFSQKYFKGDQFIEFQKLQQNQYVQYFVDFVNKYLNLYHQIPISHFLKSREIPFNCSFWFIDVSFKEQFFNMCHLNLDSKQTTFQKKININDDFCALLNIAMYDRNPSPPQNSDIFCFISNQNQMTACPRNAFIIYNNNFQIPPNIPEKQVFMFDTFSHFLEFLSKIYQQKLK